MADGLDSREGREELEARRDSGRSSDVDSGLSVQPCDAQGGNGDTAIRSDRQDYAELAHVTYDDGRGSARVRREDIDDALVRDGGRLLSSRNWDGSDNLGRQTVFISRPEATLDAQQPDVQNRYRGQAEETTSGNTEVGLREGDELLKSEHASSLERILPKALNTFREILDVQMTEGDIRMNQKFINIKRQAAKDVVDSVIKVNENLLKAKEVSSFKKILDMLENTKKRLYSPTEESL